MVDVTLRGCLPRPLGERGTLARGRGRVCSCHLDCAPDEMLQAAGPRWHCRNSYVLAPPSRDGAGLAARWLREPEGQPPPDPVRLLEYLADAGDDQVR